jgi:hypothetical protein
MDERINMKKIISEWFILIFSIICIVAGIASAIIDIVKK